MINEMEMEMEMENDEFYSMNCNVCGKKIEYDEGEGNFADGFTCYECIDNAIDNQIEEMKIVKLRVRV